MGGADLNFTMKKKEALGESARVDQIAEFLSNRFKLVD